MAQKEQLIMSAVIKRSLPPHDGPVLCVVDMHTGGEPVRIVLSGAPAPEGRTLLEKRRWVRQNMDWVRRVVMLEPRGHRDMYGVLLADSEDPEAHLGVLFMHNEGYSTMCGHAVIALGRFALDYGLVKAGEGPETPVKIHCPCGPVQAYVSQSGAVRFHSVPAFTLATDVTVDVPGHGKVVVDVAYGGAFYAFVRADRFGLDVCTSRTRDLVDVATAVTASVKEQVKLSHPDSEDLAFLYGTILTDGNDAYSEQPTANICIFADAQVGSDGISPLLLNGRVTPEPENGGTGFLIAHGCSSLRITKVPILSITCCIERQKPTVLFHSRTTGRFKYSSTNLQNKS
uniref:trans-L-3-hydroxyproline dehydratase n=1 Tax=Leptobrachium leishanense TaxID=445787 RepID=A0A8C5PJJ1_9ANUR